jgi:3D (Asp-Asp-Asp) domain-containing protein
MRVGGVLSLAVTLAAASCSVGCSTAGSAWMSEPATAKDDEDWSARNVQSAGEGRFVGAPGRFETRVIGGEEERRPAPPGSTPKKPIRGRSLGTFRNTYYDFPTESDFAGDPVTLRDARCGAIAQVPRAFNDAVCVQGSGILGSGRTVSFAKRDCDCAEICPKTGQKICFESLDPLKFPWGRGALGTPITPLVTVAVDDAIIPMGTALYIPELDGLPIDAAGSAVHDGCFIAQDRGLRVKGEHVDVFTGYAAMTALWNRLVPSNHGVTVVLEDPHCARAESLPPSDPGANLGDTDSPQHERRHPRRTDNPSSLAPVR